MAKKILHVTYDMRIGGTERVIINLLKGSDPSYQMSIFCIESPLGPWGVKLQKQGLAIFQSDRKPGFDRALIRQINKVIKSQKIDIVHCHQYTPWVYGTLASLGTSAKVIFTEHGRFYPDRGSWKRRIVNPILNCFTAHITAISKATAAALSEFEYLPKKQIKVIYNGIEPVSVAPSIAQTLALELGIKDTDLVFGTIARFDPIKNHPLMLRAFTSVLQKYPNARLLIVGDGEEKDTIIKLANQLGIQDSLIMPGYQSDPSAFLGLMDIFLLSSLSEGTSMTLLEAMSLGKPCIVTNAGGNKEVIADQINGEVCANDDLAAFSSAMLKMAADSELQQKYSVQAKQRFNEIFSVQQMASAYANLYEDLA
ncbi:glycosyltransferase [Gayadomonas joobiniege]|uniref:glycosyltransferase n=1 Tax=Gayadomonas joobiniege TaxID=1234606 RepID=UPI00037FEDBE|nr:glycosyltransferase [Gayadomonas joobiniege]